MNYIQLSEMSKNEKNCIFALLKNKNYLNKFLDMDISEVYEKYFENNSIKDKDFNPLNRLAEYIYYVLHQKLVFVEYYQILRCIASVIVDSSDTNDFILKLNNLFNKYFTPRILVYPLYGIGFKEEHKLFSKYSQDRKKEINQIFSKKIGVGIYKPAKNISKINSELSEFSQTYSIELCTDFESQNKSNNEHKGLDWLTQNPYMLIKSVIVNSESYYSHQEKLIRLINIKQSFFTFYSFLQQKSSLSGTGRFSGETKDFKHYLILWHDYERIPFNDSPRELFGLSELYLTFSENELCFAKMNELEKVFLNFERSFFKYFYDVRDTFYKRFYFRAYESLTFFKKAINTDETYNSFDKIIYLSIAFELLLSGEYNKGMKVKLVNRFAKILNLNGQDKKIKKFEQLIETRGTYVHNGTMLSDKNKQKDVNLLIKNIEDCIMYYIDIFMIMFKDNNAFQKRKNQNFDSCIELMIEQIYVNHLNSKP